MLGTLGMMNVVQNCDGGLLKSCVNERHMFLITYISTHTNASLIGHMVFILKAALNVGHSFKVWWSFVLLLYGAHTGLCFLERGVVCFATDWD